MLVAMYMNDKKRWKVSSAKLQDHDFSYVKKKNPCLEILHLNPYFLEKKKYNTINQYWVLVSYLK